MTFPEPIAEPKASVKATTTVGASAVPSDVKFKPKYPTEAHPHPYLKGNFYPVFEETVGDDGIECEVVGVIPDSLRGSQYVRTGPNSLHIPEGTGAFHYFDGDGMHHGVYFDAGPNHDGPIRPRYMNRYARTELFHKANKQQKEMLVSLALLLIDTKSVFTRIMDMAKVGIRLALNGVTNVSTANTALAFVGTRLLALQEAGVPFETSVPSLDTVGEWYFEEPGQKRASRKFIPNSEACTAHPKYDPKTGETVFFSWRLLGAHIIYNVVNDEGKRVVWEQPIPGFPSATMAHDFAITENYTIIFKVPFTFEPLKNSRRGKPFMAFDEREPAKFAVFPRHFNPKKGDKVKWFETPACHMFHTANAWEEKDENGNTIAVCFTACRSERFVADLTQWAPGPDGHSGGKTTEEYKTQYVTPGAGDYAHQDPDATYLSVFRMDFQTMETQVTTLSTMATEFPLINFDWYMRPELRYVYGAKVTPSAPGQGARSNGVVKMDTRAVMERKRQLLEQGVPLDNVGGHGKWELGAEALKKVEKESTQVHMFGGAYHGNEALFVPNLPRADGRPLEEDEGHVLVYVYDESQLENGLVAHPDRQVTELWIFDAKKMSQEDEPVAKVKIPRRVPYGFHGLLVTKEQIQKSQDAHAARTTKSKK